MFYLFGFIQDSDSDKACCWDANCHQWRWASPQILSTLTLRRYCKRQPPKPTSSAFSLGCHMLYTLPQKLQTLVHDEQHQFFITLEQIEKANKQTLNCVTSSFLYVYFYMGLSNEKLTFFPLMCNKCLKHLVFLKQLFAWFKQLPLKFKEIKLKNCNAYYISIENIWLFEII